MTVALRSPQLAGALISVDNAPVDANLKSDFHKYIQGMQDIEKAQIKKQTEADDVLKKYEEVGCLSLILAPFQHQSHSIRLFQFGNSSSPILYGVRTEDIYGFVSPSRSSL